MLLSAALVDQGSQAASSIYPPELDYGAHSWILWNSDLGLRGPASQTSSLFPMTEHCQLPCSQTRDIDLACCNNANAYSAPDRVAKKESKVQDRFAKFIFCLKQG